MSSRAGTGGFAADRRGRQQAKHPTFMTELQWRPSALRRKLEEFSAVADETGNRLRLATVNGLSVKDLHEMGDQLIGVANALQQCADGAGEMISQIVSNSLTTLSCSEIIGHGPMLQTTAILKSQQQVVADRQNLDEDPEDASTSAAATSHASVPMDADTAITTLNDIVAP